MKLVKLLPFVLICSTLPNTVLGHYEVKNPKTDLSELSFDLIHTYWDGTNNPPGSGSATHMTYVNKCKKTATSLTLESCILKYRFYMLNSANDIIQPPIKEFDVDLRGNGSYDEELMNADKHYDAVKIAIQHGVVVDQQVFIPRADITSLVGSSGKFRVSTFGAGQVCADTSCSSSTAEEYTANTIDLVQQNLDVACEVNTQNIQNIENTLSGEHIYQHNSNASRFSQSIGAIDFSVNCVNWLPTQKSKTLTFSITPNTVVGTGGDTAVTCGAYRDSNPTTAPGYSMSKNITVPGFAGIDNEAYPNDEIYYGIYVSSPSTSAETSLTLDCALSGELSLGS